MTRILVHFVTPYGNQIAFSAETPHTGLSLDAVRCEITSHPDVIKMAMLADARALCETAAEMLAESRRLTDEIAGGDAP